MIVAFLFLFAQDSQLDEALRLERLRIAARKPLSAEEREACRRPRAPRPARRVFRLRLRPLSFSDLPIRRKDWKEAVESLSEYYRAQSGEALEVQVDVLEAAALEGTREAWGRMAAGSEEERLGLLEAAKSAAGEGDALMFVVAGALGGRGTALWPHKSTLRWDGRSADYLLLPEEGDHRWPGILAHEFGHLLGLEDKYEDAEANIGRWCLMGKGYLGAPKDDARPAAICAVCKSSLGWAAPLEIDPTLRTPVELPPVEEAPWAAARIPVNKDGREALVLEARGKSLVVWHTGGGKPVQRVAILPTETSDRLTPWSDPPFRPRTIGGRDVWITDIRCEAGKIYFKVAPDGDRTPLEELRRARVGTPLGK